MKSVGVTSNQMSSRDQLLMDAVMLIMQTSYMDKPLSMVLIGKPGIGKSRILRPLMNIDTVDYTNDITPHYLVEFLERVKRTEKKTLVIPDFLSIQASSRQTNNTMISILREMTEGGVKDLSHYHLEFKSDFNVYAGLITAVTVGNYIEYAVAWKKTGFLSRLVPFSFQHSPQTQIEILDSIDLNTPDFIDRYKLKLNKHPGEIRVDPSFLRPLRIYELNLACQLEATPYRQAIQVRELVKAQAALNRRMEVTQEDINKVGDILEYVNYLFRPI